MKVSAAQPTLHLTAQSRHDFRVIAAQTGAGWWGYDAEPGGR
jgi:hypothetical protein